MNNSDNRTNGSGTNEVPEPSLLEDTYTEHVEPAVKEFETFAALLKTTGAFAGNTGKIFAYELSLALKSIPKLLMLKKLILPLALLFWISLSASASVASYKLHGEIYLTLIIFSAIQLIALIALLLSMKWIAKHLKFVETSEQISDFYSLWQRLKSPGVVK